MVATEDDKLAQTPGTEGLQTIEDELTMHVQIKKHIRQHNKPKKAQDYVVSPQGIEQNLEMSLYCYIIVFVFIIIKCYHGHRDRLCLHWR